MNTQLEIANNRRRRLQAWIDEHNINRTNLAKRLNYGRAYISLLLMVRKETDTTKAKHFGEKVARSIEAKLGMHIGHLDRDDRRPDIDTTNRAFPEVLLAMRNTQAGAPKWTAATNEVPTSPLSYRIEDVGPMFSIILGSSHSGRMSNESCQQAIDLCASVFESFTVSRANGYFKGKLEESLQFQVATLVPQKVIHLAAQLANAFSQEGVGLVRPSSLVADHSIYSRVIPIDGA